MIDKALVYSKGIEEYKDLTKEYSIKIEAGSKLNKKIKYNNPDDEDKIVNIISTEPILYISTEKLVIEYKSSKYIKLTFISPQTIGKYTAYVVIEIEKTNTKPASVEEVLKFNIEVY